MDITKNNIQDINTLLKFIKMDITQNNIHCKEHPHILLKQCIHEEPDLEKLKKDINNYRKLRGWTQIDFDYSLESVKGYRNTGHKEGIKPI